MLASYSFAQQGPGIDQIQLDKIVMRGGDTLFVNIIRSTPDFVEFSYPNEDLINSEYKNGILQIIYKSGRIEECSAKLQLAEINGKNDWEKVIITFLESDVQGLTRVEQITATSAWGGALATGRGNIDAQNKLKKKAAELGAPIVLIVDKPNENTTGFGAGVKLTGIAYK